MEAIEQMPDSRRRTNKNKCEEEGCDAEAAYICNDHEQKIVCKDCKILEHDT